MGGLVGTREQIAGGMAGGMDSNEPMWLRLGWEDITGARKCAPSTHVANPCALTVQPPSYRLGQPLDCHVVEYGRSPFANHGL